MECGNAVPACSETCSGDADIDDWSVDDSGEIGGNIEVGSDVTEVIFKVFMELFGEVGGDAVPVCIDNLFGEANVDWSVDDSGKVGSDVMNGVNDVSRDTNVGEWSLVDSAEAVDDVIIVCLDDVFVGSSFVGSRTEL